MNIFVLDNDPVQAAQMMCDKHIVKMILESRELLYIGYERAMGINPPSPGLRRHWNHPCAKWAENCANWKWLRKHAQALCDEYTYRYGKVHKYDSSIRSMTHSILESLDQQTPFVQCMLPEYREEDAIVAYRNYYMGAKTKLLKYTRRAPPQWMQDLQLGEHKDNATV